MATRRKYKTPLKEDLVPDVGRAPAPAPEPVPTVAISGAGAPNVLQQQLAAQQHAEELQRQHVHRQQIGLPEPELDQQHRQEIEARVDAIPDLTDHKRRFLKSHPSLL